MAAVRGRGAGDMMLVVVSEVTGKGGKTWNR